MSDPTAWMDQAVCATTFPDIFFPSSGEGGYEMKREALAVCGICEVKAHCLAYALDHALDYGIYGGLTAQERREIGRKRKPPSQITRAVCGTRAAYNRHRRHGETPCEACRRAERERSRERREAA